MGASRAGGGCSAPGFSCATLCSWASSPCSPSGSGRKPHCEAAADDAPVVRAAEKRRNALLDVAAAHEDMSDVPLLLCLEVRLRIDPEIIVRVAGKHATVADQRVRVRRLRAEDLRVG